MAKNLVAMLLVRCGKVLAEIRKANDDFGAGATWIPGGHIEKGETIEHAFLRETKEEFGVSPLEYTFLCKLPWKNKGKSYLIHYFVCKKWKGKIKNKEAARLVWLGKESACALSEEVDRNAVKIAFAEK